MPRSWPATSKLQRVRVEVFVKEQDVVLALEVAVRLVRVLLCLEVGRELKEVANLLGREVEQLEEVASQRG